MCGISGVISVNGVNCSSLVKMNNTIKHRGPDDEGYFLYKNKVEIFGGDDTPKEVYDSDISYNPRLNINAKHGDKYNIILGHRRLSILDLSPLGHLPMSYNNRYWITYNGEIYNYLELRNELKGLGYNFFTESDTEVLLASYDKWGEKCLQKFNGMWSFAIYDILKEELFIARDRYGIKPFYYYFDKNENFFFASEIKQFTALDDWCAWANKDKIYDYLIYALTDHTDETMFEGVFSLLPGCYFKGKISDYRRNKLGKLNEIRWYDLRIDKTADISFDNAKLEFQNLFKDVVSLHMRSDVVIGSALSGGLDSSSIVCQINEILKEQKVKGMQKTFSSCSKYEKCDEKKWMDYVVSYTNVDAHFIYPDDNSILEETRKLLWYLDEPYQSQSVFLGYNVFKSAKDNNVKVLLNGQGADEYLAGYIPGMFYTFLSELFFKLQLWDLCKNIKYISSVTNIPISILSKRLFVNIIYVIKTKIFGFRVKVPTWLHKPSSNYRHPYCKIKVINNSNLALASKQQLFSNPLPRYLRWEDRNSMSNSIEARVPFLDYRLVEFAVNLPGSFKIYKGWSKGILRESMKDLPDKIRYRKDKKGFITPEFMWVKENPEYYRSLIRKSIDISGGLLNDNAIKYFNDMIKNNKFDYTYWRIILLGQWIDVFNVKFR